MDIELTGEQIGINSFFGEETIQAVLENDINVPDARPDVEKILHVKADMYIVDTEVMQDKVVIDGAIRYTILYMCDDEMQPVRSMVADIDFSENVFVSEARPTMKPFVKLNAQYIGHNVINGRKLNIKTIADISVGIVSDTKQDMIVSITGTDDIQMRSETVKISEIVGDEQEDFIIREEFTMPEEKPLILELLSTDIKVTGKDMKLTDDKVVIKGDLVVSTLYIADEEQQTIQFAQREIPFTQFMDFPGMNENRNCTLHYELKEVTVEPREDSDGELRNISVEASINARVICTDTSEIDVIADAYSPTHKLNLETTNIMVPRYVVEKVQEQEQLSEKVFIREDAPEARELFSVTCNISSTDYEVLEDRVAIDGVVTFDVLYISDDRETPIHNCLHEAPFKKVVAAPGAKPGMKCELQIEPSVCNYSLVTPIEIDIHQTVDIGVKVKTENKVQIITGAKPEPIDKNYFKATPSMVMYYIQPEDTLWDIAKRYYTTVEEIVDVNDIQFPDRLEEGKCILIPKRFK